MNLTLFYMVFFFFFLTIINFQMPYGQELAVGYLRRSGRRIPVIAIFWFSYLFFCFFSFVLENFALFFSLVLMVLIRKCREMNDLADLWEISKTFLF